MAGSDLLFVYGTLRRGHDHPMADRLAAAARWIGMATVTGWLYRLDGYPGLVADPAGVAVEGDLFRMRDPATLLPLLDDYEECSDRFPAPQEYRRALVRAEQAGGKGGIDAWTYLYAWPADGATLIPDGIFTG